MDILTIIVIVLTTVKVIEVTANLLK